MRRVSLVNGEAFPEFRRASGDDASEEMGERHNREIQMGVFVPFAGGW